MLLMPVTQWIRWQCAYATNPRTLLLSWESAALFPHLIAWAKIQGYDPDEGLDPRYFQPRVLSRALFGAPEPVTVTCVTEWTDAGLIYEKGGNVYIKGFRRWQSDPTAVDRKRRQREREKDVTEVTGTSVSHADGTGPDGKGRDRTGIDSEREGKNNGKGTPLPMVPPGVNRTEWDRMSPDQQYEEANRLVDRGGKGLVSFYQHAAADGALWAIRVCAKRGWRHFDTEGNPL